MTVLSLVELSTLAVRNGIEDGTLRLMHERLPVDVHRCIFNAIAMHSTFDNPNCIDLIARPEFLDGLATFDMKSGKVSKEEVSPTAKFLDRIMPIFATVKDGEFFGSNITDLRVVIYYSCSSSCGREKWGSTLPTIIRLVAECHKLTKLLLRLKEFGENVTPSFNDEERESFEMLTHAPSNLLNVSDPTLPWLPVLENLEKLAIFGGPLYLSVLNSEEPVIPFKRLSALYLSTCFYEKLGWLNLMQTIQPTLKSLHLIHTQLLQLESPADIGILPLPMPVLEKLTIRDNGLWMGEKKDMSIYNISQCPRLTRVDFDMDQNEVPLIDSLTTTRLAQIPNLHLHFHFFQDQICALFGAGPNQARFTSTLSTRIKRVMVQFESHTWNQSHTADFSRMIDMCHDLTTFEFRDFLENKIELPVVSNDDPEVQIARAECENSKQNLNRLFSDKVRASKLISVYFQSDFDESTLNAMSENCTSLKRLTIERCPHLSDHHLQTMARRGVVLSKVDIRGCPNVRGDGLLSLVARTGSKLEEFSWDGDDAQRESIEMVLMRNCKFVKSVFKLDHVKQLASNHCFYVGSDCPSDDEDVGEDF